MYIKFKKRNYYIMFLGIYLLDNDLFYTIYAIELIS